MKRSKNYKELENDEMIYISHLKTYIPDIESVNKQVSELLPFYKDSYERLKSEAKGSGESDIIAPIAKSMTSHEMILQTFPKDCVEYMKKEPTFYLDIRSSEAYSLPVPDYYILKTVGCRNVKPLNILGLADVSLIHAFSLFNSFEKGGNYFIVSLSQRLEPGDNRNYEFILADGAISFVISEKHRGNCFCVESYIKTSNKDELFDYLKKKDIELVFRNNTDTKQLNLNGRRIKRMKYEKYDFGCMDTVYTLLEAEADQRLDNGQCVAMVSVEDNIYTAIMVQYIKEKNSEGQNHRNY